MSIVFHSKGHPDFNAMNFQNHRVEVYEAGTLGRDVDYEYLTWRKPKTRTNSVDFIRHGGTLFVKGDYYDATYQWTGPESLSWMADTDFGYFHSKCVASTRGSQPRDWREKVLKENIAYTLKRIGREALIPYIDQLTASGNCNSDSGWWRHLDSDVRKEDIEAIPECPTTVLLGNSVVVGSELCLTYKDVLFGRNFSVLDIPDGLDYWPYTVIHHGALRMAIQWLAEHQPDALKK